MEDIKTCDICKCKFKGDSNCPECSRRFQEEHDKLEASIFEDSEKIVLRDGKSYDILPSSLKNARKIMKLLPLINLDIMSLNFLDTGDEELDAKRESALIDILSIAFINYPEIDVNFIEDNIDVVTAQKLINIVLGINGLKK